MQGVPKEPIMRLMLLQICLLLLAARKSIAAAPTHYEVLGLPKDASQADLKKMYKQLARQYHPDKNPAEDAQKRFIEIQKAYEVLSDPAQRQRYDSSTGFWSDDEDSSKQDRYDGAPDGGRGVVLDSVEELQNAVEAEDLWLLHVYTDRQELFGSWMTELPEDMHLGHVNVERDEELLRAVTRLLRGRLNTVPLLVLCQHGKRRAFVPDFHSIFFGVDSAVKREALQFIDYSREVAMLYDDDSIGSFVEFQPGGSSRLRVLFVLERTDQRHYEIYSASIRLRGLASVAQLGYYEAADTRGRPGHFLNKFGIRHLPTVIISDPLTGAFELMSGRNAIDNTLSVVQGMINGKRVSNRVYPVQELDLDAYGHRCGLDGENCDWVVVLATSASLEKQPENLHKVAKVFSKTCETLENARSRLPSSFACFWLRLGRAPSWDPWLQQHGKDMSGSISHSIFVVSKLVSSSDVRLRVAPLSLSANSNGQWSGLFKWCSNAMMPNSNVESYTTEEWPAIPPALASPEELQEPFQSQESFEQVLKSIEGLVMSLSQDPDVGVIVVASILGVLLLCLGAVALCACQSSEKKTLEYSLSKLEPWIIVRLSRDDTSSKWGFGIAQSQSGSGRISITSVFEGGLLEAWNAAEMRPERRVKEGDEISAVRVHGRTVSDTQEMAKALKLAKELELAVILDPGDEISGRLCRLIGGSVLDGLTLNQCATFCERGDGVGSDMEIVSLHRPLLAWNEFHRKEGASYTTCFDVGDRVVAINGNADVKSLLNVQSPSVIIVKWRSPQALRADRFDVHLERSDVNETWGFQLRMYPGDSVSAQDMTVAQINADGLLSQWNVRACACHDEGVQPIRVGDRLVAVNGAEGVEAIKVQLRKTQVTLCFERWSENLASEKCMEKELDTTVAEIEAEPEPEIRAEENRPSPNGEQMSVARSDGTGTSLYVNTSIPTTGLELDLATQADMTNSADGWDFDLDNLLEDVDTAVEHVEGPSPRLAPSGAVSNEQVTASSKLAQEELRTPAPACAASRSAGMSPRLRKLDIETLRLEADGLVVLCASGSEEFVDKLGQFVNLFLTGHYPVAFFHEARMPLESLLIFFPRHRLCRFLHRRDSTKRCGDLLLQAGGILWQTLAGDVSLLKQDFDPLNINEESSLWSAEWLHS